MKETTTGSSTKTKYIPSKNVTITAVAIEAEAQSITAELTKELNMNDHTLFVHLRNGHILHISCDDEVYNTLTKRVARKSLFTFQAKLHTQSKSIKTFHLDLEEIAMILEA